MSAQPAVSAVPSPASKEIKKEPNWIASNWGLFAAVAALIAVLLLPTPAGLPVAGHRMLAILAFAVIVWMTEAIDYAVSAIVIAALMAFCWELRPTSANPSRAAGHQRAASAWPSAASPIDRPGAGGLGACSLPPP